MTRTVTTSMAVIAVCLLALSMPARAEISYTFTSPEGNFVFDTPNYVDNDLLGLSKLSSFSFTDPDVNAVDFHDAAFSGIFLLTPDCLSNADCFEPTFGRGDVFLTNGSYTGTDGAELIVAGTPGVADVPEPSSIAIFLTALVPGMLAFGRGRWLRRGAGVAS
jgi:hypothetical protein